MIKLPFYFLLFVLAGCAAASGVNVTSESDEDINYGYFVSIPNPTHILYLERSEGKLFLSYSDVGEAVDECQNEQFSLCLIAPDYGLTLVAPGRRLRRGDTWRFGGLNYTVSYKVHDISFVDVVHQGNEYGVFRFYVDGGRVLGFSWGNAYRKQDCATCIDNRITFIWKGDDSIWGYR
jgi:hypothetical protein